MAAKKGNKNAVGNKGNLENAFYTSPEELQNKVNEYFEYIKGERGTEVTEEGDIEGWIREPEPPTVTGLALFLGFDSRQSMYDYQAKIEFSYVIRKARTKVEHGYELDLRGRNARGAEFALKNMGWADNIKNENNNNNVNQNYNSTPMSPERIKAISQALEDEY